jgi:hypothetical protein
MGQAHSKPVWHLTRRDERPCVLSNQELLLLAKLGHLRADDLLWRPDFDGWKTVRSLLGHETAHPLPISMSLSERPSQIGVKAAPSLSRYQKSGSPRLITPTAASRKRDGIATLIFTRLTEHVARWWDEFPLLASDCLGTIQLYGRDASRHIKRFKFDLVSFLDRVEHPRNLAGLLVAMVLVGVLGMAVHKSFATDPQPAPKCTASNESHSATTELHTASTELATEPATANAEKTSESTGQKESQRGIIVRKVRVFSIDMLQPSDASAVFPATVSDGSSK